MINTKQVVESYLHGKNWRVKENSNAPFSFGALLKHLAGVVSADYWLTEVYPERIARAHKRGDMHLHDLSGLTIYCCGYSLRSILMLGVQGIPNIPTSSPAKHFDSVLDQLANLTTVFQNEIMGAVAFSSVDTLLAPFIKADNLTEKRVEQIMQGWLFSINSNSRAGAEPAFSNITLDLTPPHDLLNEPAIIGGEPQDFTYGDCQAEMDRFNRVFTRLMLNGDSAKNPFAYPIPTYNIHERFDWDNPNNEGLWEMAGKMGTPYFANFINSDMDPSDARSMCCRMNLDLRELRKRTGGLFGSGDSTGSIGVVTLDLPKYAFQANNVTQFFELLDHYLELAKESLEIKREFLQTEILDAGLLPAFQTYVGTLDNHFSTIGYLGMNEMCLNLFGEDITAEKSKQFCLEVMHHIRAKLVEFQEDTGHLYNFEATPAESTCYRLAKKDKEAFGEQIITQGSGEDVYYTNSCHLPVKKLDTISSIFNHQDELQALHTGGTVVHLYLDGPISGAKAKQIVKTTCENYHVPYVSLSPLIGVCPTHGQIQQAMLETCPTCGSKLRHFQRITGYVRDIENFNQGKAQEFKDRRQINAERMI